ncbi:MAG: hypothetical protein U0X93_05420 [Anaerolineales bacterium]
MDAFLLVGSRVSCETAAQSAAQQALKALGGAKPAFALTFVDIAWEMLLKSHPGAEIAAMREILGAEVPIAGVFAWADRAGKSSPVPQLLNQHMVGRPLRRTAGRIKNRRMPALLKIFL